MPGSRYGTRCIARTNDENAHANDPVEANDSDGTRLPSSHLQGWHQRATE